MVPGLPSKDLKDDEPVKRLGFTLGKGWTLKEIKRLVGRPLGVLFGVVAEGLMAELWERCYHCPLADEDNVKLALESGADIIYLFGWDDELLISKVRAIKGRYGDRVIIQVGRPHGPGLLTAHLKSEEFKTAKEFIKEFTKKSGKRLLSDSFIKGLIEAGADIIQLPAPGAHYGWDVEGVNKLVRLVQEEGALAAVGIHTSQEGSDEETIRRLAIYAKMTGADIYELGDVGYAESMVPPENILAFSIAIKGRRHTYRRIATSFRK